MKLVLLLPAMLAIGLVTGLAVRPAIDELLHSAAETEHTPDDGHNRGQQFGELHPQQDPHAAEDEHEHVALSREAFANLGLVVSPIKLSDYSPTLRVPGEVVEFPGLSTQKTAAPVSGVVTKLLVAPGVSVSEGEKMFELRITDEKLKEGQLRLLELLTKLEITESELARLAPLTESGSVAGRRTLELEYEKKRDESSARIAEQSLIQSGLSEEQVNEVRKTGRMITHVTVRAPSPVSLVLPGESEAAKPAESISAPADLTVEAILVEPGQNVKQGDPLCELASHGLLLVGGHAFENEIDIVAGLIGKDGTVSVEFGIEGHNTIRDGLSVQYVANHVDEHSQAFRFYVPLPNEVLSETRDALGRTYRTWRYKVGQKVHVIMPKGKIEQHIVLPREAVVQEGPDAIVFREHRDEPLPYPHNHLEDSAEESFIEFDPVPVTILKRDKRNVVLSPRGQLAVGDKVAMTSAYQLLLAMKAGQEGGGSHDHHH